MRKNPLPGVPAVESPFFDHIFTAADLTDTELRLARDLRDKGYAVFDFPDADFEARAEAIKASLHARYPWDKWHAGNADMRVAEAWTFDENVRAIATNQIVVDLLSKLYGRRAWPFQTLNFPVGTQQHFHTDAIHFSSIPERFMCGVWVALEDIGDDQGPLEYYRGSHKWPIYTNEHVGVIPKGDTTDQLTYHELWEGLVELTGVEREVFRPKKGQALIWTANLLHGGVPHRDKAKTRWSQVTHYYFEDCAYYKPMWSDPFRGVIRYQRLTDMTTGKPVVNGFSGAPIPENFLVAMERNFDRLRRHYRRRDESLGEKTLRRLRRLGLIRHPR